MRIVLLTSKLNFKTAGGSVMELHLKAKGLQELGHDVMVVTAFSYANKEIEVSYPVKEEMVLSRGLLGIQRHAFRILRKYEKDADAFYIDGQIFLYGGGLYRLLGGRVPVVAFFNSRLNAWADMSGNVENPPLYKLAKKALRYWIEYFIGVPIANRIDAFIFNTPMVQKLYEDFGLDTRRSVIIEDFVDMRGIVEKHSITPVWIERHQHEEGPRTFIATGRMIPEKGFELVIRAFAKLPQKDDYRLILSGGGPDKERLEQLTASLGLSSNIKFPGWVEKEELSRLLKNAHVFIFPKWWNDYGSALLTEALAHGLPCIIPGGGALEWLTRGNILTFHNDDTDELARQIQRMSNGPDLRTNLGLKSLTRVETLDYRQLAKQLESTIVFAQKEYTK